MNYHYDSYDMASETDYNLWQEWAEGNSSSCQQDLLEDYSITKEEERHMAFPKEQEQQHAFNAFDNYQVDLNAYLYHRTTANPACRPTLLRYNSS